MKVGRSKTVRKRNSGLRVGRVLWVSPDEDGGGRGQQTDIQTHRENSKTEQTYFWFRANHLVYVNVGAGLITRFK